MKRILALGVIAAMLTGCTASSAGTPDSNDGTTKIVLNQDSVTVNGESAGTDTGAAVYIGNDIVYYEDRDTYDSGNVYGEGSASERHTAEEAAANTVVYITEPGTYRLSGTLHGQIRVDLGEDAAEDPEAVATLIFEGADITCDVAPAVVFANVYECDKDWSAETAAAEVDTDTAGANVIIADGTVNNITGSHIARIYKDTDEQKKLIKQDAAFYSCMSMNISGGETGDGILNVTADNKGIDTELHLSINGGIINIRSQDDGINTNEDGVSVTAINGGEIHIISGLGSEGDGIDSNGWLVINGGTVIASANPASDSGLDSDMGSYINGGTVVALGSTMDWAESDSEAVTMNLQFASYEDANEAIQVTDLDGNVIFEYDPADDDVLGNNARRYMGAIISCPAFEVGKAYHVYVGGRMQAFTGSDIGNRPGGMFPRPENGEMPGDMNGDFAPPEPPDGQFQRPENGEMPGGTNGESERPEPPEGMFPWPQNGEMPGDMNGENARPEPPDGQFPGPGGQEGFPAQNTEGEPDTEFLMNDKVNAFSGVFDFE